MKKWIAAWITVCVAFLVALIVSASVLAVGTGAASHDRRAGLTGIRAHVTCHDPCDDPFQLKAWVSGSNVGGLTVKFTVKGKTFTAKCNSSGYAHYHLHMNAADYPGGVKVTVKASVTHGGVTKSASTWFKPNYN